MFSPIENYSKEKKMCKMQGTKCFIFFPCNCCPFFTFTNITGLQNKIIGFQLNQQDLINILSGKVWEILYAAALGICLLNESVTDFFLCTVWIYLHLFFLLGVTMIEFGQETRLAPLGSLLASHPLLFPVFTTDKHSILHLSEEPLTMIKSYL